MKCFVCGDAAVKRHNRINRCPKHHRFAQMQRTALADKKYVPSFYELERIVPADMKCGDCGETIHWIDDQNRTRGAVLQHYRNGELGIVCHSCNVKHGHMPGDMYRDVPSDHKLCISCKTIKPISLFSRRREFGKDYPVSKCKPCSHAAYVKWRETNPDKYQALIKKHNMKRKEKLNGASI